MFMELPCAKVKKRSAERTRRILMDRSLLLTGFRIITTENYVHFPLKGPLPPDLLSDRIELTKCDFSPIKGPPRSYKEIVNVPSNLKDGLPSSFDVIGDICIIKLPSELQDYAGEIGSALIRSNRNFRSVALDRGVKGEFRIRDLEVISGDHDLETTHIENNIRLKLDPSRVYFSPRLATERQRISQMIKGGRILDMFSGVGPFSINCARNGMPEEINGIDLNPDCIEYFETNIKLNSCGDIVTAYLGDARDAPLGMGPYDSIIMNLPHGALDFLDTALSTMESGNIHLYTIIENSTIMEVISTIKEEGLSFDKKMDIIAMKEVHNYSPTQSMMAFDINVSPDHP